VHVLLVPDVVISTNVTEKKPSGLTPIHPSMVVKLNSPKFRPLQAAGIFPRKNLCKAQKLKKNCLTYKVNVFPLTAGAIPKSRLPVPVKSKSSKMQAKYFSQINFCVLPV
jgi:hypothetical protein